VTQTSPQEQTLDQAIKGLVVGLLTWLAVRYDVPPEITVPGVALVAALLAWVSVKTGRDHTVASFVSHQPTGEGEYDLTVSVETPAEAAESVPQVFDGGGEADVTVGEFEPPVEDETA